MTGGDRMSSCQEVPTARDEEKRSESGSADVCDPGTAQAQSASSSVARETMAEDESIEISEQGPAPTRDIKARQHELLAKIAKYEQRGSILPSDAHTLRFQVHDSTSGQWRAVEERLQQLAFSWNPYQDNSASDRRKQQAAVQESVSSVDTEQHARVRNSRRHVMQKQAKKKNFYELLELSSREATGEEIKKQFRKLALQLHPDKLLQAASASASTLGDSEEKRDHEHPGGHEDSLTEHDVKIEELDNIEADSSTKFARLRVAYETLSDPEQRTAYDLRLADQGAGGGASSVTDDDALHVRNQMTLEGTTDFASLEWMARVKHKMDVMDRIAEWARLLSIRATDIRFETGEPCIGRGCGKIVSMDRDLECYGSPRRRVYVCLLHKYIHACDESCTSHSDDGELDKKVCPIRAYWLVQNWVFDNLLVLARQANHVMDADEETKGEEGATETRSEEMECRNDYENEMPASNNTPTPSVYVPSQRCELVASELHMGDDLTTFSSARGDECISANCRHRFQFLEDGVFACRRHGTAHVCTYEQCNSSELRSGKYVCWVSGRVYGHKREVAGTGTRTRQLVYTDEHGDSNAIEMDVPVLLPLGKMTSYLLEGGPNSKNPSSFSPPPPARKMWGSGVENIDEDYDEEESERGRSRCRATTVASFKREREDQLSPTRARIRRRLTECVQQADTSFCVYLQVPPAVANIPKVALELQEPMPISHEVEGSRSATPTHNVNILPVRVRPRQTLNYIKYWMEELTEQQISLWDQQIFWSDTLVGDEENVMTLEQHGIYDGCLLELRLHDDCPLLVGNWSGKQTTVSEYNTVQISKEAEEDLDEQQDEMDTIISAELAAFAEERLNRKRTKMERGGAIGHTEVIQFDGSVPRLVGVIPEQPHHLKQLVNDRTTAAAPIDPNSLTGVEAVDKGARIMNAVASEAGPVKKAQK